MFSPTDKALDLTSRFTPERLVQSPLHDGTWAILDTAGLQSHSPQLCWIDPDRVAYVWMAGRQEGTAGMSIFLSELRQGRTRWTRPRMISRDDERSEQNTLLYVANDGRLRLIHTAQRVRDFGDRDLQRQGVGF